MLWPLIEAGVVKLFIFISEGNKAGFTFNRDHVWEVTGDTLNRRQNLQDRLTDGPPETKPIDDKSQKLAAPQRIPCNRPARAEPARLRRPAFRDAPGMDVITEHRTAAHPFPLQSPSPSIAFPFNHPRLTLAIIADINYRGEFPVKKVPA